MTDAGTPDARSRTRRQRVTAGFVVGLLLVGLELVTDAILAPSHVRVSALDRAFALAPLPLLGGLLGLVFARAWLLGAVLAVFGAGRVGYLLSLGLRAQEMPLAPWWGEIIASLTFLALLASHLIERRRRLRILLVAFALPVTLAALALAAFGYRGDYSEVREGVMQVAAVFMILAIAPFSPAPSRRVLGAAFALGLVLAGAGVAAIGRKQDLSDWAYYRASLCGAYVRPLWGALGPELPSAEPDEDFAKSPYFGTEAQLETTHRLFSERRPNGLLFLTVDAMRHDLIGREVGGRPVTPFIDSLAATGYRFTRCYAPSNITNATFMAIFAGIYPGEIIDHPLGIDDMPLVTQRLRDAQVRCRGVFYSVVAAGGIYKDSAENPSLQFEPELFIGQEDFAPEELARHLAPDDILPWLSFAHYMRPHEPYDSASAEFAAGTSRFERYAAEVRQVDDEIRRLVEALRARGVTDDYWIVISADHGEEFGEHGLTFHGRQLYDESIRVPLIIAGPGVPTGVCDEPVSLIDLTPTFDEIFRTGDPQAPPISGRSLLPFLAGVPDPGRRSAVAAEMPGLHQVMRQRALIAADRKTILCLERDSVYHYDLTADPEERRNLATERPEAVRRDVAALEALTAGVEARSVEEEFPVALIEELERLPRSEIAARLETLPAKALPSAVAYWAPLAAPNRARELEARLTREKRHAGATKVLLRLAAGESDEALREEARRLLESTRKPIVAVALYTALRRLGDDRVLGLRVPVFASRHARLAVDLAHEAYRASFGNVTMNFRVVEAAHLSSLAFNRRLGADYLWVLDPPTDVPEIADLFVSDWTGAVTARRRASLVRSLTRIDTDAAREAVARTLREGTPEEKKAVLAATAAGAPIPAGVSILRLDPPAALPREDLRVPEAGETIAVFLRPAPGAPPPWRAVLVTPEGEIEIDAGDAPADSPLLVPLPAFEGEASFGLRIADGASSDLELRALAAWPTE